MKPESFPVGFALWQSIVIQVQHCLQGDFQCCGEREHQNQLRSMDPAVKEASANVVQCNIELMESKKIMDNIPES